MRGYGAATVMLHNVNSFDGRYWYGNLFALPLPVFIYIQVYTV
jgi:hypothetical protein